MRRLWIIPKTEIIASKDIADALFNGCPEIANGIPPILIGKIGALPCIYEESNPVAEPPRDLAKEIDELKLKVAQLEAIAIKPI